MGDASQNKTDKSKERIARLESQNAYLERQNAYLKRKSSIKDIFLTLLHFSLVTGLSLFIKAGIDVFTESNYKHSRIIFTLFQSKFSLARLIGYSIVLLLFFPIIGCVISNCYNNSDKNLKKAPREHTNNTKNHEESINLIKSWWYDFTSPENFKKNLVYYTCIGVVNLSFMGLQYFIFLGINELTKDNPIHQLDTRVVLNVMSVISLTIISIIFANSLQQTLWEDTPPNQLNYTEAQHKGTQTDTELPVNLKPTIL